jgi:hypothetical protein
MKEMAVPGALSEALRTEIFSDHQAFISNSFSDK